MEPPTCCAKCAGATGLDLYRGIHMADADGNSCFSISFVQYFDIPNISTKQSKNFLILSLCKEDLF